MASGLRRVAVESITDYFDTYIDHFYHKFRPLKVPQFLLESPYICSPTPPRGLMHLIKLSNDRIFRALSDGIYKIFSVLDLKNSFSVINQSTLRNKTFYQENETFDIMSNIFLKYIKFTIFKIKNHKIFI